MANARLSNRLAYSPLKRSSSECATTSVVNRSSLLHNRLLDPALGTHHAPYSRRTCWQQRQRSADNLAAGPLWLPCHPNGHGAPAHVPRFWFGLVSTILHYNTALHWTIRLLDLPTLLWSFPAVLVPGLNRTPKQAKRTTVGGYSFRLTLGRNHAPAGMSRPTAVVVGFGGGGGSLSWP